MDYVKSLMALRQALASHKMSLMVGSGFSKNVSRDFPDWNQLIFDLVYELYEDEILLQLSAITDNEKREAGKQEEVKRWIRKKGYLKVVSEYIERKGYEEAIVAYIEDRTPIIQGLDNEYYLIDKGEQVLLTPNQLRLHKFLLELPWNNVYTTNYDPLLEASVDVQRHSKVMEDNNRLGGEIGNLTDQIFKYESKLDDLSNELQTISKELKEYETKEISTEADPRKDFLRRRMLEIDDESKPLREKASRLKAERRDKIREVNLNSKILEVSYTVVKSGPELRIKRNKNIIKLHGSLRTQLERNENHYGFDNDARKQYVISVDHYLHYPEKHEAFTQLMRISLLQESFCLLGFSGDDPNFLGWIRWVRDLLYRENNGSSHHSEKSYKIYLIDIEDKSTLPDKLLFFENHSILRIPLLSSSVLDFLESETNSKLHDRKNVASVLQLFFQFLSSHDQILLPVVPKDTSRPAKWRNAWDGLFDMQDGFRLKVESIQSVLMQVRPLFKQLSIADLDDWDTHYQHLLLDSLRPDGININNVDQKVIDELIAIAVTALGIPAQFLVSEIALERISENLGKNVERDLAISNPFTDKPFTDPYYNIARLAYSFRYKEMRDAIEDWQVENDRLHLKAGLVALYDPATAEKLLEQQLNSFEINEQRRMFSYELLLFIKESRTFAAEGTRLRDQIKYYKAAGFGSLTEKLTALSESVSETPRKNEPHGEGRFDISHTIVTDSSRKPKAALKFLTLLAEQGLPAGLDHRSFISGDQYYDLFKIGMKYAPYAYVYYALQVCNEATSRLIGQEFANAEDEEIAKSKPRMLSALLSASQGIPKWQQGKLLSIAGELFIAVKPSIWESLFYEVWGFFLEKGYLFGERKTAAQTFARSGIRFIESAATFFKIISDLLRWLDTQPADVISYLFYLNRNYCFGPSLSANMPVELTDSVNRIIDSIPGNTEDAIFVLGNLHKLLSNDQLKKIKEKLKECQFGGISSDRVFRIILFFAKSDAAIHNALIPAVLAHPSLWATGITGKSVQTGMPVLDLIALTDRWDPKIGMRLSTDNLAVAYGKLKATVVAITPFLEQTRLEFDFISLLDTMSSFLEFYSTELQQMEDFDETYTLVHQAYIKGRKYDGLASGISSQDHSVVVWALSELSDKVRRGKATAHLINLVLNKILLQAPPSVETCLNYVATWIVDPKCKSLFSLEKETLHLIVWKYVESPLEDGDIPFITEMLVHISYGMQKIGIESTFSTQWLERAKVSTFNNVTQWYASIIDS